MPGRVTVSCGLIVTAAAALTMGSGAQGPDPLGSLTDEKRELASAFTGVTTNGRVTPGLFRIERTGVTTEPVRAAAVALLNGLSEDQRRRTLFPVDDREWRIWINTPQPARQGVSFEEMSEAKHELAYGLLRASLSARGFQTRADIMKLNGTLADLTGRPLYGQWKY
jgi:hypothetical protein